MRKDERHERHERHDRPRHELRVGPLVLHTWRLTRHERRLAVRKLPGLRHRRLVLTVVFLDRAGGPVELQTAVRVELWDSEKRAALGPVANSPAVN